MNTRFQECNGDCSINKRPLASSAKTQRNFDENRAIYNSRMRAEKECSKICFANLLFLVVLMNSRP